MNDSNFYQCTSSYRGGIFINTNNYIINVYNSTFHDCRAIDYGGGIVFYTSNYDSYIKDSNFYQCHHMGVAWFQDICNTRFFKFRKKIFFQIIK